MVETKKVFFALMAPRAKKTAATKAKERAKVKEKKRESKTMFEKALKTSSTNNKSQIKEKTQAPIPVNTAQVAEALVQRVL
ncbi:MAG: hypothetical protein FWE41_02055 [Coriobacteriia bacterium]|nr:hypothetical protein [Coriobacteriia bacterium]